MQQCCGRFLAGRPVGLVWQRRSNSALDGWLYGQADPQGLLDGPNITFLYPGLRRGLQGHWRAGRLVAATAVQVGRSHVFH